ncbi:MAG: hypothetical protein ACREQY_23015, partial [Candidatus Binatia bacterium]
MGYSIRRAEPADTPRLAELRDAFVRELTEYRYDEATTHAVRAYLERAVGDGSYVAWVAEAGTDIVGTGGMVVYERMVSRTGVGREAYVLNVYTR